MRQTGMRDKSVARDKHAGARSSSKIPASAANGSHVNGKATAGAPATISRPLSGRPAAGTPRSTGESLEQSVFRSLEQYFANLDGAKPHALHEMVLGAIEKPLLQFALLRCEGNQSAAADLLGINRNTLRRKLQDYGLH